MTENLDHGAVIVHGIRRLTGAGKGVAETSAATAHHALANHLASILGYGELLKETSLTPRQAGYLDEILDAARQLAGSGGDMFRRICHELGTETEQPAPLADLPVQVDQLMRMSRPILERRKVHAGPEAVFRLSWQRESGHEVIPCSVCGRRCPVDVVRFTFADNGAVIHRDQLPYFFQPGFNATMVLPADAPMDDDVGEAVRRLHAIGGHVAISSTDTQTAIYIYIPVQAPVP